MEINTKLSNNPMRKVALLITKASDLGMDISGYGYADENQNSGYVYLWLEDYPFTLFMRPCGDDEICALWTNSDDGEETEIDVTDSTTLDELQEWADDLQIFAHSGVEQ